MDCLVLPVCLLRKRSMRSRLGYRPLKSETEDGYGELESRVTVVNGELESRVTVVNGELESRVTVVVGKEKREFLVDPFVLEESPFRVLIETMKKGYYAKEVIVDGRREKKRVIFVDVDAILFEHMLWLMNNDCSSLFKMNLEEIIDFYAQDY